VAEDLGIGPLFADFFKLGFWGLVFEVLGDEGRPNSFLGEGEDVEGAGEGFGAGNDGVADAHFRRGLGNGSVEADGGAAAGFARVAPCFINADGPEPFI